MNQSFRDFHLVMVDDASQDGTLSLAQKLAQGHTNVTVVSLPENRGRCFARNYGTTVAQSSFLAFLDQDDSYHPDFLHSTIQILQNHNEVDAVRVLPNVSVDMHPLQYKSISDSLANTMVFRRQAFEFLGGWPEGEIFRELAYGGEDVALRNLFLMIFREGVLDKPLYNYNYRPGNALDLFLSRSEVINDQLVFHSGQEDSQRLREEIGKRKQAFAAKIREFIYQQFQSS